MRTMYDAIRAGTIPSWADMVAGYCDTIKIPQWTDAEWGMFPNAIKVRIAKKATTNDGHVLDVEIGDATPGEAPGWAQMRRRNGAIPTIYCNASTWPAVRSAFHNAGVDEPYYWIAKYDGDPNWPDGWKASGVVAKQWRNTPEYDLSSVANTWPGVDIPFIAGKYTEGNEMQGFKTATEKVLVVPCNGLRQFFCEVPGAATGEHADGHLYFIADTPAGSAQAAYTGDRAVHFDADRPGPVGVPANTRAVVFYYTASTDFGAWCA